MNNLGNVVGLLKSVTPPLKTYIIWAKILNISNPDVVRLYYYNGKVSAWEPFDLAEGFYLPPVKQQGLNTPPGSPAIGDRYIIGTTPSDAWASYPKCYTEWSGTEWLYVQPKKGQISFDLVNQTTLYQYDGGAWQPIVLGGGDFSFNGNRPITRPGIPGLTGVTLGGTTVSEFLEGLFPAEPPIAYITGGGTRQFGNNTNLALSWSLIKKTHGISSITVNGANVTPSSNVNDDSDPAGNTQAGSSTGIITPINTPKGFNIHVVSTTGETADSTTYVDFMHKRYWGTSVTGTLTDSDIIALNSELSSGRQQTRNGFNGAGNYLIFAWPTSFGTPTFKVNGLTNNAWTKVRSASNFVNSDGYTAPFDVWKSDTVQNSPLNVIVE